MIPAHKLRTPESVDSGKILEYLATMAATVSPNYHDNRRHELNVIERAMDTFGPEFEDFMLENPDALRSIIFTPDVMMTTHVSALEKAREIGYSHAHTCYDKTPRPLTEIIREVRDLATAGLLVTEVLWRFDPWTGTITACGRPLVYHCSTISWHNMVSRLAAYVNLMLTAEVFTT